MGKPATSTHVPQSDHEAEAQARAQAEQQLWRDAADQLNALEPGTLALYKTVTEDALNQAFWRLRRRLYDCRLSAHQVALLVRRHIHGLTEPR